MHKTHFSSRELWKGDHSGLPEDTRYFLLGSIKECKPTVIYSLFATNIHSATIGTRKLHSKMVTNLGSNIWNSEGDWPGVRARSNRTLEGRDIFAQIKDPTVYKLPFTTCLYHHCQVGSASSHRSHWFNQSKMELAR